MNDSFITYYHEELIMTLIIISSDAEKQIEIMGFGNVGDDMMIDFETYYSNYREVYIATSRFNQDEIVLLDEIDEYLSDFTRNNSSELFIDQDELVNNPKWEMTRQKASELLGRLNMNHLSIRIKKSIHINKDGQTVETIVRTLEPGI
ncbi:hypothetical protein L5D93_28755 [Paenibacillus thiaminolyticus]|nr:hypothetical protein [Paenibacillus thiaminolyticus]